MAVYGGFSLVLLFALCSFPCFFPYEEKQGKLFMLSLPLGRAFGRKIASFPGLRGHRYSWWFLHRSDPKEHPAKSMSLQGVLFYTPNALSCQPFCVNTRCVRKPHSCAKSIASGKQLLTVSTAWLSLPKTMLPPKSWRAFKSRLEG